MYRLFDLSVVVICVYADGIDRELVVIAVIFFFFKQKTAYEI